MESPARPGWAKAADYLTILQPVLGVLIYVAAVLGSPAVIVIWVMFLASLVPAFTDRGVIVRRTPFDIPVLIFLLGLSLSFAFSLDKGTSLVTFQTYLVCLIAYYGIVVNGLRSSWYWRLVVVIMGIFFSVLTVATLVQPTDGVKIFPHNAWLYQAASYLPFSLNYPVWVNALGTVLGISAPGLFAYAVLSPIRWEKATSAVLGIVAFTLVVLIASSSGLIAALSGLAFLLFLWRRWTLAVTVPVGAAWLVLTVIGWPLVPEGLGWLLPNQNLWSRVEIWTQTFQLLKDHFLFGLGPGVWYGVYSAASADNILPHPHNDLLQLASDAGILAVIAILASFAVIIRLLCRMRRYGNKSSWYALGIACGASLIAGASNGVWETAVTGLLAPELTGGLINSYKCLAIPLLWVLLGLFVTAWLRISASPPTDELARRVNGRR